MVRRASAVAAILASFVALGVFALAASAEVTLCPPPPGPGPGQCGDPQGVAVDTETGNVYVADRGNERIDVFESDGTPLPPIGVGQLSAPTWIAVDNDVASVSRHDIYVSTDEFLIKKFKPNGELIASFGKQGNGSCEFERANDPIAVGPGGDVYVADSYELGAHNFENRVERLGPSGSCVEEHQLFEGDLGIRNFAVDSGGNSYVTVAGAAGVIRKYNPSGTLLYELDSGSEAEGLAVDSADNLFAKQNVSRPGVGYFAAFTEYSPTGDHLKRFGYVPPSGFNVPGLAALHSSEGDLFASEGEAGVKYLNLPPPGPVAVPQPCAVKEGALGNTKATLRAEVNPEGKASSFHFEYVTDEHFKAEGFTGAEESSVAVLAPPDDFELHETASKVEGLAQETLYHCRVVAENADSLVPTVGEEGTFKTREGFEFGPAWVSEVGEVSASVNVEGNPLGIAAKGQIEYVEDAKYKSSGFAEALKAPAVEVNFGASEEMQLRRVELSGLVPGTLYHYRLRAKNGSPPEGLICPEGKPECPENEHTFRTYPPEPGGFDNRGYELVSPGQKNSAEVAVPGPAGGFVEQDRAVRIQASSGSGEAITYTSWTSFGKAEGAPSTSQYLSKRTASGWGTENISPFGFEANLFVPPYLGFTPDLGFGAEKVSEPALAAGCPEGFENFYLREDGPGTLRCLTPEAPNTTNKLGYCFTYAGASGDGSRVFFSATVPYAAAPKASATYLYEWHEGKLHLVNILPGGEVALSGKTSFGVAASGCQTGQTVMRHVVAADGSKVFWTYKPSDESKPSQLLVRVNGTETLQLDAKAGRGVFWAASTDGLVAYFTDTEKLVAGAKAEEGAPDLYRYELGQAKPLTDLTKGTEPGDVRGVIGASDDGSYVYFVAGGVLSGEEKNSSGEKAQAGKNNLYLSHAGKTSFIALLANEDEDNWESQPKVSSARVSADGHHLAFLSVEAEALAGYDNLIAATEGVFAGGKHCRLNQFGDPLGSPLCPQAFLYDSEAKELTCASCNPSGSRPLGPTLLPGWTSVYEGPRYLSDNGSRLFFEAYDPLLVADENQKRDVYEFERPGEGTCSEGNPNFDPVSGGCHFLISSGKSADESYFVDASSDGRDAFFSTRGALVGWDVNDNFDVYDYREGGGFAEPVEGQICVGEGCLPPQPIQPSPPTPATPTFTGPGNAKAKKSKPKHHHKKKPAKKKPKHNKRRAGR
jgi:hypothetical protein